MIVLTTIDTATRWAKRVDLLDGLVVDNWGIMTLDGERHVNRYPFDTSLAAPAPAWEIPEAVQDQAPDVVRMPDHMRSVAHLVPQPLPPLISLDPSSIEEIATRHQGLYPYIFARGEGYVQVFAAFAPEINTWWIGGIRHA